MIRIIERENYIEAIFIPVSEINPAENLDHRMEMFSKCKETGKYKLLILTGNAIRSGNTFEMLKAVEVAEKQQIEKIRIAVVTIAHIKDPESLFIEDAMHNRGMELKLFENESSAKQWLGV